MADVLTTTVATIVNTTTKCTKHLKNGTLNNLKDAAVEDHSMHNMGAHSGHNMHDDMGMSMSFHLGYQETILFDFWTTNSVGIFILSCVILFVMAALYEGLKLVREKLIRDEIVRKQQIDVVVQANSIHSSCHCPNTENKALLSANGDATATGNGDVVISTEEAHDCCKAKKMNQSNGNSSSNQVKLLASQNDHEDVSKLIVLKSYRSRLLNKAHLIQTVLHMFQITVSYLLMLVFMTYNTWLCLSVVLGAGLGYFFFGLKRLTTVDVNEHCH